MTSPNRSKKSRAPKADTPPASRDLTPSEIESLQEDPRQAVEDMDRDEAEEESQKTSDRLPPNPPWGVDGPVDDPRKPFRNVTGPESPSQIKAAFKAGRLSREEAVRRLQALGFE